MSALIRLAIAVAMALIALHIYNLSSIDPERFGIDATVMLSRESWNGRYYTASTVEWIKSLVADYQKHPIEAQAGCKPFTMLWLGNSQLHFVNQAKVGDHVSPYWLRNSLDCPSTTVPLGVSLPNANLQEHYVLEKYVTDRVPVRLILLAVCFDKLRGDGLRPEFASMLDQRDRAVLSKDSIGREIVQIAQKEWKGQDAGGEQAGLTGFAQKGVEDRLNAGLEKLSPLWADREKMRLLAFVDLYHLRNAILGIKGTTVRKSIPGRRQRNMRALEALLSDARERGIRTIMYIQPIRQDLPIPYDRSEYEDWKRELSALAPKYGATLLNFETLVPGSDWGVADTTVGVDFMHFRNQGHKLVATALLPYVRAAQENGR